MEILDQNWQIKIKGFHINDDYTRWNYTEYTLRHFHFNILFLYTERTPEFYSQ